MFEQKLLTDEDVPNIKVGTFVESIQVFENGTVSFVSGAVDLIEKKIGKSLYLKDSNGVALIRTDGDGKLPEGIEHRALLIK